MKVRYLGTYIGNVEDEVGWLPGEVRDVADELGARLAEAPLWEATDDPVGVDGAPAALLPDTATDKGHSAAKEPAHAHVDHEASKAPSEAVTPPDEGNDDEGAGARRGRG